MSSTTITRKHTERLRGTEPISDTLKPALIPARYFAWKPWIERPMAAILLLPAAMVIAALVILVRCTSSGPAIFRQQRVGRNGRIFTMYKIRTMRQDAETLTGAVWAQQGDPRITTVGRVLRKLHLDEFPQLINVLKGDMSLIGPRPERPEFTQRLGIEVPGYLDRLQVLPGITGLAQINLPPDTDIESVRRKLHLDLRYVSEASLFLDLRMFLCTATRIVGVPGDLAMRSFGLRRPVPLHLEHAQQFQVHQGVNGANHYSTKRAAIHPHNGHSTNGSGHLDESTVNRVVEAISQTADS
ncbi:MAG: sugar transferase [Pirellulales bacterium]|nr:sugar transferase [Pirellulales bacterium]